MRTWLMQHAESNVWAKPSLDGQLNIEVVRISNKYLDRTFFNLLGEVVSLPTQEDFYAAYDIGFAHPMRGQLNIDYHEGWITLDKLINRTGSIIHVYNLDGKLQPACKVYLRRLMSDGIVLAIKEDTRFLDVREDNIYMRIYDHNIKHEDPLGNAKGLTVMHREVTDPYSISNAVKYYEQLLAGSGYLRCFINGFLVEDVGGADLKSSDLIEYYIDNSIIRVERFKVSDLQSFSSTLDKMKKYLIHFPKQDVFQFHDDIDIFIFTGKEGRYYHKHYRHSFTQLTHGDFAVSAKQVEEYAESLTDWDNVELVFYVKDSGFIRDLKFNDYRIHELYRLSDEEIINVMTGLNSHLPFWQAANLEVSDVNKLRCSRYGDLTHKLVSDAYGYNAAVYYSAQTPNHAVLSDDGRRRAALSPMMESNSTVYEYDTNGLLLGWWDHYQGEYICRRNNTAMVEAVPGSGGEELEVIYGAEGQLLSRYTNYRFYIQRVKEDGPVEEFLDVTGDDSYYTIDETHRARWTIDTGRWRSVIITDKRHLIFKEMIREEDGLIRVGVKHKTPDGQMVPSPFKFATVEIWLNSHSLVYGIDYLVDWPSVTIINKTHLVPGIDQEVVVRCRAPAREPNIPKTGFVVGGLLSDNDYYDVKDDKVTRIVVDGGLRMRDAVSFREDLAATIDSEFNGTPYSIDTVAIPADDLLEGDYEARRLEALDRDKKVEDFLTIHYPRPQLTMEQPLEKRYPLYSPIINKMITDYERGILSITEDDDHYRISTSQLDTIFSSYEYLLDSDPAHVNINDWFIVVEPHWGFSTKEIPALLYTVLERANHRYFNGRVDLNRYLTIRND